MVGSTAKRPTDIGKKGTWAWQEGEDLHPSNAQSKEEMKGNTWEVGHRSRVLEGVVWRWGEGEGLFRGSCSNFFGEKCPARMTSYPKEVSMSWDHLMHAIEVGEREA